MPDVPSALPSDLIAGTTWQWDRDYSDFPQPTYVATAYFENAAKTFSVAASASGTAQRFTIAASTTSAYPAGRYRVRVIAVDAATGLLKYSAEETWVDVEIDPAAAGVADPRSWARQTLDAIEAFLLGNASTAQASMSVGGRAISRWPLSELTQWRDQLRGEVRAQEQADNAGMGRDIRVRFSRG